MGKRACTWYLETLNDKARNQLNDYLTTIGKTAEEAQKASFKGKDHVEHVLYAIDKQFAEIILRDDQSKFRIYTQATPTSGFIVFRKNK